jgi:hypothetical protein
MGVLWKSRIWQLSNRISRQIWSHMRNGFSPWISALGRIVWWKKRLLKISWHCHFKVHLYAVNIIISNNKPISQFWTQLEIINAIEAVFYRYNFQPFFKNTYNTIYCITTNAVTSICWRINKYVLYYYCTCYILRVPWRTNVWCKLEPFRHL